jgi:uncharacterized membrane protein YfcA
LAFAAAAFSAVTGIGGGMILLSGLLLVLPTAAIVPVHGAVQLAAGSSRVAGFWKHIRWDVALRVSLGIIPGSLLGLGLVAWLAGISPGIWKVLIAIAILASLIPAKKRKAAPDAEEAGDVAASPAIGRKQTALFVSMGLVLGTVGIVVGSTGPLMTQTLLRAGVVKEAHVATKAAVQSFGHLLKLPLFGLALSFDYGAYTLPLIAMIAAVIAGTWLGKRLLEKLSADRFVAVSRVLLFLIAIQILVAEAAHAFAS